MPDLIVGTNTYVTLDTADAHFDARLHADSWNAASDDDKTKALLMAAVMLDRFIRWNGSKAFPDQPLEWPRIGISWIPAGSVPLSVRAAQMELALVLLSRDTTALPETAGMKSIQADTLKIEVAPSDRVKTIPDHIMDMVRAYGSRPGGLRSIELARA